jgi:hypothetical protein
MTQEWTEVPRHLPFSINPLTMSIEFTKAHILPIPGLLKDALVSLLRELPFGAAKAPASPVEFGRGGANAGRAEGRYGHTLFGERAESTRRGYAGP